MSRAETLKLYQNLNQETISKMKDIRRSYYHLAKKIEELGSSRENSIAFSNLETSLMYAIKHLCASDPDAGQEHIDLKSLCKDEWRKTCG